VHECINFLGKAPAAAREDMWADLIEGETRGNFPRRSRRAKGRMSNACQWLPNRKTRPKFQRLTNMGMP
jgi:hypothetical protein